MAADITDDRALSGSLRIREPVKPRSIGHVRVMSAFPTKADIRQRGLGIRFVPIADTVPSKSCLKSEGSHYYAVR
jgi:hypothetical protein